MDPRRQLTKGELLTRERIRQETDVRVTQTNAMQHRLQHLVDVAAPDDPTIFRGIYSDKHPSLSSAEVRELAAISAPPLGPVDTTGLYHLRSIKHPYPIPGSQLRREKERELQASAKKQLVFLHSSSASTSQLPDASSAYEDCLHTLEQGKLHFLATNLLGVLNDKEAALQKDVQARQHRLATLKGDLHAVQAFWHALLEGRTREAVLLVTQHDFVDVNLAVNCHATRKAISIEPNESFAVALTPLMLAARRHNVEVVTALLQHGADPQLATANQDTALHFTWRDVPPRHKSMAWVIIAKQAIATQEVLLAHGALANHANMYGVTALHDCARLGLKEAVVQLLRHDGDPHLRDKHGKSSLDLANEHGHKDIWSCLATFHTIARVRTECDGRRDAKSHFKTPGLLSHAWSPPPDQLLATLKLASHRATFLKGNYITQAGALILADDAMETWAMRSSS
ncbi:hypothetical protein SPRG_11264 [Saprolegnia parasitica CBS 223.65]|uniref:Uncharacterized protein n=1 Tax=Saprolegnia parasitica (strain CBS 223.65) TaxID=695850 RepID=A0A067CAJ0_SAPPC|nr:hypothetical protein SPRG_11264 [Saprolegnia parasitica CBS 223.65]KDO23832.1 hypothetical protein SPRG_11264 [Saprolegnia parasitica CBS 223.65]|eukprot:XP_012205465.1 hypothetical protein SPRG_11264 [Saprolegnia parasitica CBS 223.65]